MEITDTTPLRLDLAAKLAFPDGSITLSSLRRESKRGNLRVWRVAGKDMTTLAAIKEMMDKCLVTPNQQDCGSGQPKATGKPSGASLTGESASAQIAARLKLQALKDGLKNTSQAAAHQNAKAPVIPIKSR